VTRPPDIYYRDFWLGKYDAMRLEFTTEMLDTKCQATGPGGSRVTVATGLAVYEAAHDALRQLKQRAAKLMEKKPEEIEFNGGIFSVNSGAGPLTLKQLAAGSLAPAVQLWVAHRSMQAARSENAFCDSVRRRPGRPRYWQGAGPAMHNRSDVDRALHPSYAEGQAQGGFAQGIGWALNEEYVYDGKGVLRNAGLLDYRMPTCRDLPQIEAIMVEVPNPNHPLAARGAGAIAIVPPMAAVTRIPSATRTARDLQRDRNTHHGIADVAAARTQGDSRTIWRYA
jgi:CO/xanthine dehydrogenase Mo-binding subunit